MGNEPSLTMNPRQKIEIDVAGLRSVEALVERAGKRLKQYSELFRRGASPEVVWDLRGCLSKRMNMATVTAFLAIADRLREFSGEPQKARVQYDPKIFQFWDDIDFISLVHDLDLFEWEPSDVLGGYLRGGTNPDTKIFAFSITNEAPPRQEEAEWISWKDRIRDTLRERMLLMCGPLFREKRGAKPFPRDLPTVVANTCAELVLNASLWGPSDSFVGLQRTASRITAAVCDTGKGVLGSLAEKSQQKRSNILLPRTDTEAIVMASLINRQDFGLRRAISSVLSRNGWVMLSSAAGLLKWQRASWRRALEIFENHPQRVPPLDDIFANPTNTPVSADTATGYHREFSCGLRGVRVSFEIPIEITQTNYLD